MSSSETNKFNPPSLALVLFSLLLSQMSCIRKEGQHTLVASIRVVALLTALQRNIYLKFSFKFVLYKIEKYRSIGSG